MTFKRYSVMVDFGLYPFTLSKYAVINLARHSAHAHNIHFSLFHISATTGPNSSRFFMQIVSETLDQMRPNFDCR